MRILILMSSLEGGGAERITSYLASHWASQGHAVTLAVFSKTSGEPYSVHAAVEIVQIGSDVPSGSPMAAIMHNFSKLRGLRGIIRQFDPDSCLTMLTANNVLLALARIGMKKRFRAVGSERSYPGLAPINWWWRVARRVSYGLLDALVAQTTGTAEWIRANTAQKNVPVIPNFAKWPLASTSPQVRPEAWLEPGSRVLLGVGRLVYPKNWGAAIEAFSQISGDNPDWRLVILGEGGRRPELERLIAAKNLGDRVLLPGRAGNLGEWYQRADLMVLSSHYEGFPNVILEAMSYGLPCVSVACREGPADIIRDGIDGVLVEQGMSGSLSEALQNLMKDDALRARLAQRAVQVRERFSAESILRHWDQVVLGA